MENLIPNHIHMGNGNDSVSNQIGSYFSLSLNWYICLTLSAGEIFFWTWKEIASRAQHNEAIINKNKKRVLN